MHQKILIENKKIDTNTLYVSINKQQIIKNRTLDYFFLNFF